MSYSQKWDLLVRVLLGVFFLVLSLLAIGAPIIQTTLGYPNGEGIYSILSPICHQYPTRSLWILNRPFALCSRCFAGYLGLGIGFLAIYSKTIYLKRILIGLLLIGPGVLDGLVQLGTNYESTNIIRLVTGLSGGLGVFHIIYPLNVNVVKMGRNRQ